MDDASQPLNNWGQIVPPCIKDIYYSRYLIMIDESADRDD